MKKTLLAVLAHADDESFGLGGTLALYARRGCDTYYLCATRGEAGSVDEEHLKGFKDTAELRSAELMRAAQHLGLKGVFFLGYRDSGMPGMEENKHPDAQINHSIDEVAGRVVRYIRDLKPDVVLTFDPIGGYKHPDHIALKGRMFLPESPSPITSSYDVGLVWRVSGGTDFEARAFASEDGHYISLQPDGSILAVGDSAGLNETFSWSSLGGDKAALRAANSMYLALQANGTLAALSDEMTSACEFAFKTSEGGLTTILASNGRNLVTSPDGTLSATGVEVGGSANFTEVDLGVVSSPMSLATYYEDFMLTGMTVDENPPSTDLDQGGR